MKKPVILLLIIMAVSFGPACRKLNPIIPRDVDCVPCGAKHVFADPAVEAAVRLALFKPACDISATARWFAGDFFLFGGCGYCVTKADYCLGSA